MDDATKEFSHFERRLFGRTQRQSLATLNRRQPYGHFSLNGVGAGDVMQRPPFGWHLRMVDYIYGGRLPRNSIAMRTADLIAPTRR